MIRSRRIHIPIPRPRNTKILVYVNDVNVTARVVDSHWITPVTTGIGTFNIKLSNSRGQYSGDYSAGDVVKFYADNTDASTLQFWGRVDYVKDDISNKGQFLEIEGRHRSFLLTEHLVCYSANAKETSEILKEIIDQLPASYGFTYTNILDDTTTMSVEWSYKPFWDCVVELANKAGFDCYVDDNLDFHYFTENSIENNDYAISESDNFISSSEVGTDDYFEKTRVRVMGEDVNGLPILFTAKSAGEGTEIREIFIKDSSANTYEKIKDLAESKLEEVTNLNLRQNILSHGLQGINPGDNIWIIVPRQKIAGQYKLVKITHRFGMSVGGWRTEVITEEEEKGVPSSIKNVDGKAQGATKAENVNKLDYTYNFDFSYDSGTHDNTVITPLGGGAGTLRTDGSASGTWVSPISSIDDDVSEAEVRGLGLNVSYIKVYFSLNGGSTWTPVTQFREVQSTTTAAGRDLRMMVKFSSADAVLYGVSLLYSTN